MASFGGGLGARVAKKGAAASVVFRAMRHVSFSQCLGETLERTDVKAVYVCVDPSRPFHRRFPLLERSFASLW